MPPPHSPMRTDHAITLMEWRAVGHYFTLEGEEGDDNMAL